MQWVCAIMVLTNRRIDLVLLCKLIMLMPTGKGCVYSYDPVGSYERESCRAAGAASALLQPLLDNQVPHSQHLQFSLNVDFA
jgi:20S proteasome subunit beta 6